MLKYCTFSSGIRTNSDIDGIFCLWIYDRTERKAIQSVIHNYCCEMRDKISNSTKNINSSDCPLTISDFICGDNKDSVFVAEPISIPSYYFHDISKTSLGVSASDSAVPSSAFTFPSPLSHFIRLALDVEAKKEKKAIGEGGADKLIKFLDGVEGKGTVIVPLLSLSDFSRTTFNNKAKLHCILGLVPHVKLRITSYKTPLQP